MNVWLIPLIAFVSTLIGAAVVGPLLYSWLCRDGAVLVWVGWRRWYTGGVARYTGRIARTR